MELIENNWGHVRCPKCDSVMGHIVKEDIHDSEDGHYMICPVCKNRIWFGDEYEPHPIVQNALSPIGIPHR